ncbi:MAG: hypothetical protein HY717_12380 [Planctomycetes bacterium]|nr:hypothetical protein [Planctomycetota bacterium]
MIRLGAFVLLIIVQAAAACGAAQHDLFPSGLSMDQWLEFKADGFAKPVTGVIYSSEKPPCCGVPMGGISTGCIDIDASGTWGMSTIFSDFTLYGSNPNNGLGRGVPRHPASFSPFLGLSVGGRTWLLTIRKIAAGGKIDACHEPALPKRFWVVDLPEIEGVGTAKQIRYWGHYPVADLQYDTDAPVEVSMRAWSPFIPGDAVASNIPGSVFEVRLRNHTGEAQEGTVAFSFPGPADYESRGASSFKRATFERNGCTGVTVSGNGAFTADYALGVISGPRGVRFSAGLGANGAAWAAIDKALPTAKAGQPGTSCAVDFKLPPEP